MTQIQNILCCFARDRVFKIWWDGLTKYIWAGRCGVTSFPPPLQCLIKGHPFSHFGTAILCVVAYSSYLAYNSLPPQFLHSLVVPGSLSLALLRKVESHETEPYLVESQKFSLETPLASLCHQSRGTTDSG